jgi:cytoskeletal protein RodZ
MLGTTLRQAREERHLPLSEIEWATRIKADYLAALEAEEFDRLPGAAYARGFLRTYATYLGLDPEPLVAEYNASATGAGVIVSTRAAVRVRHSRFAVTPGLIAGVALLLVLVVFAVYPKSRFDAYQASQAANVRPSPQLQLASPVPTPSTSPSPAASPSPSPCVGVCVAVKLDADVWLRVQVDGKDSDKTGGGPVGKTFPAGTVLTFNGTQQVEVRSGKAVHTFLTVNGQDLGVMKSTESGGVGDQTFKKA